MKKIKTAEVEPDTGISWAFIFNYYVFFLFLFLMMVCVNAVIKGAKNGDVAVALPVEAKMNFLRPPSFAITKNVSNTNHDMKLPAKNPKDVAVFWYRIKSTVFDLTSDEIQNQFETAKVSGLKRRVRRFACWHSCFGKFTKKVIRKPYSALHKTPATIPGESRDENAETTTSIMKSSAETDDETTPVPEINNELTSNENSGVRKKKESNPEEYFKENDDQVGENKETSVDTKEPSSDSPSPPFEDNVKVEGTKDEVSVPSETPSETEAKPAEEEGSAEDENESGEIESGENEDDTSGSEEEDDDTGKDKPESEDEGNLNSK